MHGLSHGMPVDVCIATFVNTAPALFCAPENISTSPITAITAMIPRMTSAIPLCSSSMMYSPHLRLIVNMNNFLYINVTFYRFVYLLPFLNLSKLSAMSITYFPSSSLNMSGSPLNNCTRSSSYFPGSVILMLSKSSMTGRSSFVPTRFSTSCSICCFCSGFNSCGIMFFAASSFSFLM